jgi:hypothetical protein
MIICLNCPGRALFAHSSRTGNSRIGASGDSNWSEICVVSMTPRASRKYVELIPIMASSHSTAPGSGSSPSPICVSDVSRRIPDSAEKLIFIE